MCIARESAVVVPAHVGHVLDVAPVLRELHPDAVGIEIARLVNSVAWTLLVDRRVLCICGIQHSDRGVWFLLLPQLLRHRAAFSEGACALITAIRWVRSDLADRECELDPDKAREWVFAAAAQGTVP
jgi:hypothetical protein